MLPGKGRCAVCRVPTGGVGGLLLRPFGLGYSRKSPNLCNLCETKMPPGGAEIDIAVLFADIRGSTALGESMGPRDFAKILNRFYRAATSGLSAHDAVIDKMIGDEVMAFFNSGAAGQSYRLASVLAAEAVMNSLGYGSDGEPWLPVGIGVHAGLAYVGKVGTGNVNDFTALGDTINVAARLQAEAAAGEIVISEPVYQEVATRYPGLEKRDVTLRGREEPLSVRVIHPEVLQAT